MALGRCSAEGICGNRHPDAGAKPRRWNVPSGCLNTHEICRSACGMRFRPHPGGLRLMSRLVGKSVGSAGDGRYLGKIVFVLLCVTAINLALILLTADYTLAHGPLRFSADHLQSALLLFLSAAIASTWVREGRRDIPTAMRLRSPLLLFLGVVFLYSLNGRALTAGDTIPASYLPLSILREFDFDLDEFPFLYEPELPWFVQRIEGHIVSAYPPWAGVLALPVYLLPVLGGLSPQSPLLHDLEKLSATLITALSVVFLLLALRRLTNEKLAWCIALVYAFGTSSFSSSSQTLWQHGPSQLLLTLMIYWLVRGIDQPNCSVYAGAALTSAILCRPTNALIALPIGAYMFLHRRNQFIGFTLAGLPPVLVLAAYNMRYFGSPFTSGVIGSVSPLGIWSQASFLFSTPLQEGLAGVLGSPSRGLFVYSPILLVAVVGIVMVWSGPHQALLKCLSFAPLLITLLTAKWISWWGGGSYGPRLLADITPILCLYLYPPLERAQSRPLLKYVVAGLAVLSIGLHAMRVFGGGDWNGYPNVDWHRERLWSWSDSPPVYFGKNIAMDAYAKLRRFATALPTSQNAPNELAASYHLMSLTPDPGSRSENILIGRVGAVNIGEAVWLSRARGEKGEVRLIWRWFAGEREVPSTIGGWSLGYDVLPGQAYEFAVEIVTPKEPGEYTLEFGLVSMRVASFAEQGTAPLRILVQVTHRSPGS
jgi:Dolichyl-phosphate-mannose-protein mannosyltransferase